MVLSMHEALIVGAVAMALTVTMTVARPNPAEPARTPRLARGPAFFDQSTCDRGLDCYLADSARDASVLY